MSENMVFTTLRDILARHQGDALVTIDTADHFALARPDAAGKPAFLAAVQAKKSYVAVHLFPVYTDPTLLDGVSSQLKKRMQGKSCFNFKSADTALTAELETLVQRALAT